MNVKVGDIVETNEKGGKKILPAVVTKVWTNDVEVLFADGTYGCRGKGKYQETGRRMDIQSVLDEIR